eukprot:5624198-Prymnesium_polylepis.2
MGAANKPAMSSVSTRSGRTPSLPTYGPETVRKPATAATVTKNSLTLTVPITLAGERRPSARRPDVATGPHPPPPVASMRPPTNPRGRSSTSRLTASFSCERRMVSPWKRNRRERGRAEECSDDARRRQAYDDRPLDVAETMVSETGGCGGPELGKMNAR